MELESYPECMEEYLPLAGRILLGAFFLFQGVTKLTGGFSGFTSYVESLGIPAATVAAGLVVLTEAGGGLALLTGFRTKLVGLILGAFLLVVNLVAHPFWASPDQLPTFMKNLALIGGLLLQSAAETGRYSLDSYLE